MTAQRCVTLCAKGTSCARPVDGSHCSRVYNSFIGGKHSIPSVRKVRTLRCLLEPASRPSRPAGPLPPRTRAYHFLPFLFSRRLTDLPPLWFHFILGLVVSARNPFPHPAHRAHRSGTSRGACARGSGSFRCVRARSRWNAVCRSIFFFFFLSKSSPFASDPSPRRRILQVS